MKRLAGKTAIITGGASGIGKATCELFAEEGCQVVIADIDETGGQQLAEQIQATGGTAIFISTNVTDEPNVQAMVAQTVEQFERVDILVNNAAIFVFKGIDATIDDWHKILSVNVIGAATVAKHVVTEMKKTGGGAIVNLASVSSFVAQPQFVTYNSTKAAIASMTRCMALDLAEHNIRVNAVGPGSVWTPIVEQMATEKGLDRAGADADPELGGMHMLKRLADPLEIARPILFLASDDASFITAECLMIDGGYTAQ
jgi:dihydroanticapsin dehydrogenase